MTESICQKRYVNKILNFEMFWCNPTRTPVVVNEKLKKKRQGKRSWC